MAIIVKGVERPPGTDVEVDIADVPSTPLSFLRAFAPDTVDIPQDTWVTLPLDPSVSPWRTFGEQFWEFDEASGGIRCLKEGIYSLSGGIVYDDGNQTGDRAVDVVETMGPYANKWGLASSGPMAKVVQTAFIVGGQTYQFVDNVVELKAYSTVSTKTSGIQFSNWLSVVLINAA